MKGAVVRSMVDNSMFVVGPAMEIFPMFFVLVMPDMNTAPGDMILNSGDIMLISVRIAPVNVSLNSAHRLCFCAVILCAISWVKKDVVRISVNIVRLVGSFIAWYGNMPIDSAMPVTSSAAIVRCLVSVLLKCIFVFGGWVGM